MKAAPQIPRLHTLQDVQRMTGIPVFTLRRLCERRELTPIRVPGIRRVYLDAADVARVIENWRHESQEAGR